MHLGTATKKVIVEFPETLLKEAEEAASKVPTDRSKWIRAAVEASLEASKKAELDKRLADGYRTHDKLDREIAREFAVVDADNF